MDDLVVVIPARGGSQRIKGKNIRPLAGKPLVHWAIEYAKELEPKVIIVSTDSDDVAGVVRTRYPEIPIARDFKHTDQSTVDEIAKFYHSESATTVVIQPTMIGDVVENLQSVLPTIVKHGGMWRLSGLRVIGSLVSEVIGWSDLKVKHDTTLIDIDTLADFAAAELYLRKQTTIGIYYKAGEKQGWGHEMRAKTLADALQDYTVTLVDAADAFQYPYPPPDVVIFDIGDTKPYQLSHGLLAEGSKVITIEDNGRGAKFAHASINSFDDLKYAVLRPEFYNLPEYVVRDEVKTVLLSFGGQNNHGRLHSTQDTIHDLYPTPTTKVTLPREGHMASQMLEADVLFCAGGTTALEAIKVGVPTIVIPALPTEAMRPHLSPKYGVINLGITPSRQTIRETYVNVCRDKMLRQDMSNRMKAIQVGDGTVHIRRIIEDLCQA